MNCERRALLLVASAWPFAAFPQQPKKIYRIGYFANTPQPRDEAFRQRLGELGYVDGKNAVIEWRFTRGQPDRDERSAGFVAEFLRLKVDCIVVGGVGNVRAAKQATATTPIVILTIDGDPVELGFIASLARPGGNVTGFTGIASELAGKRLELLRELAPKATRAAVLIDASGAGEEQRAHLRGIEEAGKKLGLQLKVIASSGPEELEAIAFNAAREWHAELLSVVATGWINSHRERIVRFAAGLRLPAIYSNQYFPPIGGLMSYSADLVLQARAAAGYVARILSGTKPADLPVQQPTKFELMVNLKTAKALGLTIPPTIMVRADKVID
jgi:putative ABC transport system substrate-binding protein